MAIRIISKNDGFRRCGMPHSAEPKVYDDDYFTKKELKILLAEPRLMVITDYKPKKGEVVISKGEPIESEDAVRAEEEVAPGEKSIETYPGSPDPKETKKEKGTK